MPPSLTQHLQAQQEPLRTALAELVRIPSVCDEGGGGYPFGAAIDQALHQALQIASDLGFRTKYDEDGYYGYAEIGAGAEMVGVLGHLDVVPPGNLEEWEHGPFEAVERRGVLYGRGAQDDKGPMLAALFAVKALVDAGVEFSKRVRFIFGTDEETLWRCIKRYNEKEETPTLGFSPDSAFPLTFAEKGLLQLHLRGRNDSVLHLAGGCAFNTVPDVIVYEGEHQKELATRLDALDFAYSRTEAGIEVQGKAAHAAEPENGCNAIARLCIALQAIGAGSKAVRFVAQEVGEDPYATRIFGDCRDEASGRLKFNVGMIELNGGEQIAIDCRIPVTVAKEAIVTRLREAASHYGLEYEEVDWLAPLYLPLDHSIVRTLMRVYAEVSGDYASRPLCSGGATYARAIANCVAFGALFPDEPETEHQPNERVVLANLNRAMEIFAHAVYELTR